MRLNLHLNEIEKLISTVKKLSDSLEDSFDDENSLFKLKMGLSDLIGIEQDALEKINLTLQLYENENLKQNGQLEKINFRNKDFWRSQIDIILRGNDKPMKTIEILSMFSLNSIERRHCISILSNVLNEQCKIGELKKYKVDGEKGYYYMLPNMTIKKAD